MVMPKSCECSAQGQGNLRGKGQGYKNLTSRRCEANAWPRGLHHCTAC